VSRVLFSLIRINLRETVVTIVMHLKLTCMNDLLAYTGIELVSATGIAQLYEQITNAVNTARAASGTKGKPSSASGAKPRVGSTSANKGAAAEAALIDSTWCTRRFVSSTPKK